MTLCIGGGGIGMSGGKEIDGGHGEIGGEDGEQSGLRLERTDVIEMNDTEHCIP